MALVLLPWFSWALPLCRVNEREREREREEKVGWGLVRDTTVLEVRGSVIETEFGSLEGSQAVHASPSGKGEACIRDLFKFDF
jgi:hypothetical protein